MLIRLSANVTAAVGLDGWGPRRKPDYPAVWLSLKRPESGKWSVSLSSCADGSSLIWEKTMPSESVDICLAVQERRRGPPPPHRHRSAHTLITSSVSAPPRGIRQPRIDTDGGSSFKVSEEREGATSQLGGIECFWDCLLPSCNWINLASNLFRPVTLLHPHEANLRCPYRVYAQLKLIRFLVFFLKSAWTKECVSVVHRVLTPGSYTRFLHSVLSVPAKLKRKEGSGF